MYGPIPIIRDNQYVGASLEESQKTRLQGNMQSFIQLMKDKKDGKGPSEKTIKLIGNGLQY